MRVSEDVRWVANEDGGVLLDINRGVMFSLNLVGSKIVEKLKVDRDPDEIADEIAREFAIVPEVARADVNAFLDCLRKNSLVQAD
jgi:Coenzyme PQQ synthesis protein D (PqqD)